MKLGRPSNTPETFWKSVAVGDPSQCWNWTGALFSDGYGTITYQGRQWRTHRLAYTLNGGALGPGDCVCHKCDNKRCCNPAHFFIGTYADNNKDRAQKGRSRRKDLKYYQRGEDCAMAKLTNEDARKIRAMYPSCGLTHRQIGALFGVGKTTVGYVLRRKTFAHID